ncbi:MAG: hypothetical protein WD066_14380, partial [Planctomycetaceae bacterium]
MATTSASSGNGSGGRSTGFAPTSGPRIGESAEEILLDKNRPQTRKAIMKLRVGVRDVPSMARSALDFREQAGHSDRRMSRHAAGAALMLARILIAAPVLL